MRYFKDYSWWRVRVLGRSVPVALLLLAAIVTTAAAGWLGTVLLGTIDISAGGGYEIAITGAQQDGLCLDADPVQGCGLVINSFTATSFDVSLHDISPDDWVRLHLGLLANATNSGPVYLGPLVTPPSWAGVVAVQYMLTNLVCGSSVLPGQTGTVRLEFDFAGSTIQPNDVIAGEAVDLEFTATAPTCP